MSGRSRFLCARNEDEPEEKINNRKSAIYRGSANRLRMPDANRLCVERLWIRDESRIYGGARKSAMHNMMPGHSD